MSDAILVLNAGSSSLRFTEFLIGAGNSLAAGVAGNLEELYGRARFRASNASGDPIGEHVWDTPLEHSGALEFLFEWLQDHVCEASLIAVGHRVVHGGAAHAKPMRVDATVLEELATFVPLAPLHQPHNLLPIQIIAERRPDLAQVACFDTAFHRTVPLLAQSFALPPSITDHGVRRYGFHGLSYEYIASELPRYDARAAAGRTVALHLGNGASMCAMRGGKSIATTMGFTAIDGLPMGTRCGNLDPGVILYLMQVHRMDASMIESLLYKESGLLGVSGISSDMRGLLESSDSRARFAIDLFVYWIGRELGSLTAALGGLDAIVFTAGIGERATRIREAVCKQAEWLGVDLDRPGNAANGPRISSSKSRVAVWVIPTNEELMIAKQTQTVVFGGTVKRRKHAS